jgi:hypothetical protein
MEQGMAADSGYVTCRLLNRLLHRIPALSEISHRTMTDLVSRNGGRYLEEQASWADCVLKEHGWDPVTALPSDGRHAVTVQADPGRDCGRTPCSTEEKAAIDSLVADINSRRLTIEQIPSGSVKPYQVEADDKRTVKVSLDGVSAKRQKDRRPKNQAGDEPYFRADMYDGPPDYSRAPDPKKRPKVETSVAVVEVDQMKYIFAARNMFEACKFVLAFLLSHDLLEQRDLVFFVDGGKDIRKCINDIFAFCPHQVVLDWFHLKKHCLESLSMALYGGRANREMQYTVRRQLFHILWTGNVEGAITYLESLDSNKVKNKSRLDEIITYLRNKDPEIACYAVRRRLGLRLSSNRVEKANDLIVAGRQKGKGMSWSRQGSWSLAGITTMYLNHEAEGWHRNECISHQMYEGYGHFFVLKSEAA